jgi:putative spermidine/putrescine transport system substrate-binding protein
MAACSSSSGGGGGSNAPTSTGWNTATSAQAGGGMDALIAAAKAEGTLNVIALPRDWANYGELMDNFTAKYGIKINDASPTGTSAEELNAIKTLQGQDRAPDVVDVGMAFAYSGTDDGLYAPYQVATWNDIPDGAKDPDGNWYSDYGGVIAIGCDASKVNPCPTSFKDLDKPAYKGMVTLNGDPTGANAAINGVAAVALAKGGTLDNIQPGIDYFAQLNKDGIYKPVQRSPSTIETGETPIVIDWDYLIAAYTSQLAAKGHQWTVTIPADSTALAGYYAQAVSKTAPHPAAGRLWMESLYSVEGQNGFLKGGARPVTMDAMTKAGTIDATLAAALPTVPGTPVVPNRAQAAAMAQLLVDKWPSHVGKYQGS